MSVTGTIRFLFGAALVAAGGTLVAPLVTSLAAAARTPAPASAGPVSGLPPAPHGAVPPVVSPVPAPSPGLSQADGGLSPPDDPWAGATDAVGGLQLDRCPPPPPAPLPPAPRELSLANPALGAAYRSTLHVAPPPLLDSERPPPTVSWAAAPLPTAPPAAAGRLQFAAAAELTVPPAYRIQDGDDLGTIAGRFYGQPAAASAIWAANRETIPNPDLLPIGVELRLPPPWAVGGQRRPVAGAIEPAAYARPVGAPPPGGVESTRDAAPWLAPASDIAAPVVSPNPASRVATATSVRVAPGETLATLARRLYGDPAMADAIFAANRDRIRSPELVVPGMELRLPRPITAPRP